jgi:hypothetical protein
VRARSAGNLKLGRDLDVVELGRVQPEDLLLALGAEAREVGELLRSGISQSTNPSTCHFGSQMP